MTLFIACLLIYGFGLWWGLYPVAVVLWVIHIAWGFWLNEESEEED
jgi:hypothetical protein